MTGRDEIRLFKKEDAGLAWGFQVNPDSCGNPYHYEEYIRFIAISDRNSGKGTTHIFTRNISQTEELLGYITLRASSYTKIIDGVVYGNPALEIFELAVKNGCERQGIGRDLVKFAIASADSLRESAIGIEYITLCADEHAVPFYEKCGFGRLSDQGIIPRENWNKRCIPMLLKLPESNY